MLIAMGEIGEGAKEKHWIDLRGELLWQDQ